MSRCVYSTANQTGVVCWLTSQKLSNSRSQQARWIKNTQRFNCLLSQMAEQSLSHCMSMGGVLNISKPDWATCNTWLMFLIAFFQNSTLLYNIIWCHYYRWTGERKHDNNNNIEKIRNIKRQCFAHTLFVILQVPSLKITYLFSIFSIAWYYVDHM